MEIRIEDGKLTIYEVVLDCGGQRSRSVPRTDYTWFKMWGVRGGPIHVKYRYPHGSANWGQFKWDYRHFKPYQPKPLSYVERAEEPMFTIFKTGELAKGWKSFIYWWQYGMGIPWCVVSIERIPGIAATIESYECSHPFSLNNSLLKTSDSREGVKFYDSLLPQFYAEADKLKKDYLKHDFQGE